MDQLNSTKTENTCKSKDLMHRCPNCNYYNCLYLSEDERTKVYHYEEAQSGLL